MLKKFFAAALLALAPLGAPAPVMAQEHAQPVLEIVPLQIATATGTRRFKVEVARTADQQHLGLMFRRALGHHAGMIFPMSPPQMASFWMKNTLIPLDLIFIRADGSIARIDHGKPLALDLIGSQEPVVAVLEIGGGRAAAMGIHPDDKVTWRGG